jgi:putative NADH-flavin reductase
MKILLLGASGRTGKIILQKAIQDGLKVTAIVRDKSKLEGTVAKIIEGTPYYKDTVLSSAKECDAVISTLNISRTSDSPWAKLRSPEDLISRSVQNAVEGMRQNNVKRIIVLSVLGAGDSKDKMPMLFNLFISMTNLRYAFKDHTRQEEILAESGLEWTVIRLPMLTDDVGEDEVLVNMNDGTRLKRKVNRETVARFILNILNEEKYYKKTIAISNK